MKIPELVKSPVLKEEDLEDLNRGIEWLEEGLRQRDMMERAGLTLPPEAKQLDKQMAQIQQIKQTYFPGR